MSTSSDSEYDSEDYSDESETFDMNNFSGLSEEQKKLLQAKVSSLQKQFSTFIENQTNQKILDVQAAIPGITVRQAEIAIRGCGDNELSAIQRYQLENEFHDNVNAMADGSLEENYELLKKHDLKTEIQEMFAEVDAEHTDDEDEGYGIDVKETKKHKYERATRSTKRRKENNDKRHSRCQRLLLNDALAQLAQLQQKKQKKTSPTTNSVSSSENSSENNSVSKNNEIVIDSTHISEENNISVNTNIDELSPVSSSSSSSSSSIPPALISISQPISQIDKDNSLSNVHDNIERKENNMNNKDTINSNNNDNSININNNDKLSISKDQSEYVNQSIQSDISLSPSISQPKEQTPIKRYNTRSSSKQLSISSFLSSNANIAIESKDQNDSSNEKEDTSKNTDSINNTINENINKQIETQSQSIDMNIDHLNIQTATSDYTESVKNEVEIKDEKSIGNEIINNKEEEILIEDTKDTKKNKNDTKIKQSKSTKQNKNKKINYDEDEYISENNDDKQDDDEDNYTEEDSKIKHKRSSSTRSGIKSIKTCSNPIYVSPPKEPISVLVIKQDKNTIPEVSESDLQNLGWSTARIKAYYNREHNPNAYYYRFNDPGVPQATGQWNDNEKKLFMQLIKKGVDYQWGIFSTHIPGRVGYQCSNFYRLLVKDGEIVDPNYVFDEKGKLKFQFRDKDGNCTLHRSRKTTSIEVKTTDGKTIKRKPTSKPRQRVRYDYNPKGMDDDYDDDKNNSDEDDEEEEEEEKQQKPKSVLPGFIDPVTMEEIEQPAISPYGHVMGYYSWMKILNQNPKNTCPYTKQKLTRRMLVKLDEDNIEEYRNKILNYDINACPFINKE
ncbi:hypothetical protein WA158_002751 [Blastocystis sp. Blastoise]